MMAEQAPGGRDAERPDSDLRLPGAAASESSPSARDRPAEARDLANERPGVDALIRAMAQALVDEADPEQVILFGSRARGESGPDSDVDLIVVEREPFGTRRNRRAEMHRLDNALRPFPVPSDVLVYSLDEVEYWRDSINHVLARALREGVVLYTRPRNGA